MLGRRLFRLGFGAGLIKVPGGSAGSPTGLAAFRAGVP